jgi:hypothetical protein
MGDDLDFHRSLTSRIWRRFRSSDWPKSRVATLAALGAWQVANAAGFVAEAIAMRKETRTTGRSPEPHGNGPSPER